jgi:hypothetical protein
MKKFLVLCAAITVLTFGLFLSLANALTITYTDRGNWESAAGGMFIETADIPGYSTYDTITAGNPINIGYGETLTFNKNLSDRKIGNGWATWSGGYTGEVLWTLGATSVTGSFGDGGILGGFGFESEPDPFASHLITLALSDGSTLSQAVNGNAGAKFFGWTTDIGIASMTIASDVDFAFGRFVSTPSPVPEPSTILLLVFGFPILLGAAGIKKRGWKN